MYHYRLFTDGSVSRAEAINIIRVFDHDLSDCYGICWQERHGALQYLHFDEMSGDELMSISQQIKHGGQ